ncbi:MAG: DUF2791 family P-loop domain-containing protein [Solobacterium sp.]|nr:DUF2791 family P-loop domain-containing protein [Solobacterium sp.]
MDNKAGIRFLLDFWQDHYLNEYISEGGSKIKFITGREGSGKTFLLSEFQKDAERCGYLTVYLSAEQFYLNDFSFIYLQILNQIDLDSLIRGCASRIAGMLNYDMDTIGNRTLVDYLASIGASDVITMQTIRSNLREMFLHDSLMDYNFASACALLTADVLGHPSLDGESKRILKRWLTGDRALKSAELKSVGLSSVKINRYNARHMLRSLGRLIRKAGHQGLIVLVDDLEILLDRQGNDFVKYSSAKRNDTYESIRQLVDDIDTMKNLMFIFAFDRAMIDNENIGLKSYQALWMRIQNEIVSRKFNRFSDIVDMDILSEQVYTPEYLSEMSLHFAEEAEQMHLPYTILDETRTAELLKQSEYGSIGLAQMIKNATLQKEGNE